MRVGIQIVVPSRPIHEAESARHLVEAPPTVVLIPVVGVERLQAGHDGANYLEAGLVHVGSRHLYDDEVQSPLGHPVDESPEVCHDARPWPTG